MIGPARQRPPLPGNRGEAVSLLMEYIDAHERSMSSYDHGAEEYLPPGWFGRGKRLIEDETVPQHER